MTYQFIADGSATYTIPACRMDTIEIIANRAIHYLGSEFKIGSIQGTDKFVGLTFLVNIPTNGDIIIVRGEK